MTKRTLGFFQLAWLARYLYFRLRFGLTGDVFSYCGRPTYHNGLRRLRVHGSLGIFPGWRLEFLGAGGVQIQGRVRIGHNFHAVIGADIVLKDGVVIAPDVYISTYESELRQTQLPVNERPIKSLPVDIGENVFIGKGAMIFPGVKVGRAAVIGAYTLVRRDVQEGEIYTGTPCNGCG